MSLANMGLILISSVFHAVWNILTQNSKNSTFLSGLKGLWIMALGLGFYLFFDFQMFPPEVRLWMILSGVLHGLYILSLSRAYSSQDISYVYPIARSAPVFVPVFAWALLGERLDGISFSSIGMILLAVYLLHFEGHLIRGFKKLGEAIFHKDLRWSFITLALVVTYSLVDKRGMEIFISIHPEQAFANGIIFFFAESAIGFSLCNLYLFGVFPRSDIFNVWKQEWRRGLVAGVATLFSYGLICVVLQFEAVSPVVALRQTSVLMVVFWGVWRLGEPLGKQRLLVAVLMVMGVGMMSWTRPGV